MGPRRDPAPVPLQGRAALCLAGIAGGWLLAFTFSFDEFIIAWFVSGFEQTLPVPSMPISSARSIPRSTPWAASCSPCRCVAGRRGTAAVSDPDPGTGAGRGLGGSAGVRDHDVFFIRFTSFGNRFRMEPQHGVASCAIILDCRRSFAYAYDRIQSSANEDGGAARWVRCKCRHCRPEFQPKTWNG